MYVEKTLAKFKKDKSYEYFPGNTIIHFIKNSSQIQILTEIQNEMSQYPLFNKFVLLPTDSYHMTVCDLLTYADLFSNERYTNFKHKNLSHILDIDNQIYRDLGKEFFELHITMVPVAIQSKKIVLRPKSKEDEMKLVEFREFISKKIGFTINPNYTFHISLAYQLQELTPNEKSEMDYILSKLNEKYLSSLGDIIIDEAVLALFNDMSEYRAYSYGRDSLGVAEISYIKI